MGRIIKRSGSGLASMGMYDRLYSRIPLPDCNLPTDIELQTKDLECLLDCYVIDADGRLLLCQSRPDDPPDPTGAEDTGYHGDLCFYTLSEPDGEPHEFLARFTHGRLEWIRRNPEGERTWRAQARRLQEHLAKPSGQKGEGNRDG
ncbi:conserved hypothetical protein [uncultured Defluviicoccus sp.]|uniref:Uncharacterized protein n=1 Tax=metagenome TaxID=256318 RepID=A0A380TH38_9ZZZZ|nr:conserved hypothetical protein [uncultured Defluviicoccus sp.]